MMTAMHLKELAKYSDYLFSFSELCVFYFLVLRMLKSFLQDQGYEAVGTVPLSIVIYLALTTQVCIAMNLHGVLFPDDEEEPSEPTRLIALDGGWGWLQTGIGFVLVSEGVMAVLAALANWSELLSDVMALIVVQAFIGGAVFITSDFRISKRSFQEVEDAPDLTEASRRRSAGG